MKKLQFETIDRNNPHFLSKMRLLVGISLLIVIATDFINNDRYDTIFNVIALAILTIVAMFDIAYLIKSYKQESKLNIYYCLFMVFQIALAFYAYIKFDLF